MKLSKLYSDPELAQFYEVNDHDRLDYKTILSLANDARSILDIGCGTGVLSAALSARGNVTAIDPASAMLDIAKLRYRGKNVEWVEGDARNVRLAHKFDFIVLSGHAFQVFLEPGDQLSVLKTIAAHLTDDGVYIFDSRNPNFPGSKERSREQTFRKFHHSQLGDVETWNESNYDGDTGILTYVNGFCVASQGEEKFAQERIKYTSKSELSELLSQAGLEVNCCYGNWDMSLFHELSKEIIMFGGLKKHSKVR